MNYYNENNTFAADWLENLIKTGLIPDGKVDRRSITEVRTDDVRGFTQCHFFAGIGGWSRALQLAGWGPDRPVWTGSCPCQPFSQAGKKNAQADERHLWPEMFRLIRECQPDTVFGEQVASAIGHGWLDGISDDLERKNYAVGAIVLGAFSVGAPHKRSRLYWVAETSGERKNGSRDIAVQKLARFGGNQPAAGRDVHAMCQSDSDGRESRIATSQADRYGGAPESAGCVDAMGDNEHGGCSGRESERSGASSIVPSSPWSDYRIIHCTDGKSRRVGRGVQPWAHGIPARKKDPRMGYLVNELGALGFSPKAAAKILREARSNKKVRLKGYGNAIVPQVAAEFVMAFMDCEQLTGEKNVRSG